MLQIRSLAPADVLDAFADISPVIASPTDCPRMGTFKPRAYWIGRHLQQAIDYLDTTVGRIDDMGAARPEYDRMRAMIVGFRQMAKVGAEICGDIETATIRYDAPLKPCTCAAAALMDAIAFDADARFCEKCHGKSEYCCGCRQRFVTGDMIVDTRERESMMFLHDKDVPGSHSDESNDIAGLYHNVCIVQCDVCEWATPAASSKGWVECVLDPTRPEWLLPLRDPTRKPEDDAYVCLLHSVKCGGCDGEIGAYACAETGYHPGCMPAAEPASDPDPEPEPKPAKPRRTRNGASAGERQFEQIKAEVETIATAARHKRKAAAAGLAKRNRNRA
jgi:hypothetical protein